MKIQFMASVLIVSKNDGVLTIEPKKNLIDDEEKCQVGGNSDDPDKFYCIDNGCKNCTLHSKDIGDGKIEYWCTCD